MNTTVPGWKQTSEGLYRSFHFSNFSEAFAFMTRVALLSEQQQHHPKWTNVWNLVEVWLVTHDAGNTVTEKDAQLAGAINDLM